MNEVNYTEAQVARMHEVAPINSEVAAELAVEFGKKPASVRAKAVREGIYVAKEKTSKNGAAIERKEAIVADIAKIVGSSLDGLEKAPKGVLQRVRSALVA